jgi:hypothetical protein
MSFNQDANSSAPPSDVCGGVVRRSWTISFNKETNPSRPPPEVFRGEAVFEDDANEDDWGADGMNCGTASLATFTLPRKAPGVPTPSRAASEL